MHEDKKPPAILRGRLFMCGKKHAASSWGEELAATIRSWTGRGGDDRAACLGEQRLRRSMNSYLCCALAVALAGRESPSETQRFGSVCD
jgi:hypothetical protein